jgi:LuxR family maltose regulon positive regulatory protein
MTDAAASGLAPPLLATKLFIPTTRQTTVPRPQLAGRLDASLSHPLTLVAAPAGFGKTTLVSTWARRQPTPVAWLSLDEGDNDPVRFLGYLVAALQTADPSIGQAVQSALGATNAPPPSAVIAALINDLSRLDADLLLVLDDLHLVDAAPIHDALATLVAHQPPQLHLMLVTREDPQLPLARLRARGELVELRGLDLRFTPAEAALFLHEVMGLTLDADELAALDARIEGWAAGLQLAALSLQNSPNPGQAIARLSGSHHFILNYLADEVLRQLSSERQSFLLETAVLAQLNGDLCDAVTGRTDSRARLEELLAANIFVIPLDDEHRWYRYHHLFADLLRHQLQRTMPGRAAVLQQRASAWYEAQGDAAAAVDYALAAADYPRAVRLLEQHARSVVLQGCAQTVETWLRRLPEAWRQAGPRASLAFGWSLLLRGQIDEIEPYLHDAEAAGHAAGGAAIQAEALALRAGVTSLRGDPERGCELARAAVALAPANDLYVQSMTAFCLGTACNYAGRDAEAIATYRAALPLCTTAGNRVAATLIVGNLTLLYSARGQLRAAADLCLATLDEAARTGEQDAPSLAVVYGGYADLLYAWNELDAAQAQVARVLELSRRSGHVAALAYGSVVQARLLLARGNLAGAGQVLAVASELRQRGMPAWVAPHIVSQQVVLALARNDLAAAEQALLQTGVAATDSLHHTREVIHLAHLRLLLHQGRDQNHARLDDADELARRILAAAMRADRMGRVLEVLLLRAQVSHVQGDVDAACADVMQALTLGESEGYVRIFVNEGEPLRVLLGAVRRRLAQQPAEVGPSPAYVDRLLAAFPQEGWADGSGQRAASGHPVSPPLVEALTERELEVLRLMAEGLTYDEVAQRLIVSLNTVRYHVKGLYGKLGVDKRMAAIEQARVYGLL